jgi:hypothetical protein
LPHSTFVRIFAGEIIKKLSIMQTTTTKEMAVDAWKKALVHKKEASQKFEKWLQSKGIEGKVVAL